METCTKATRAVTASYIEAMLIELRKMSVEIETDFLTYLLEMALIEASDVTDLPEGSDESGSSFSKGGGTVSPVRRVHPGV